jgi:hypothetical protein
MRPLFISATKQDTGKTSTTIGLLEALRSLGRDVGYMKPVGQHYVDYRGHHVDEDVVVLREAFGLDDDPKDMNPVAIRRGFTADYIFHRDPEPLQRQVAEAFGRLQAAHEVVLIEGTGHAGVGACLDLSNARVAQLLRAKVVIVTDGGVGRAIDEVALSLCLFGAHQVPVLGVLLNKVWPEKLDRIRSTAGRGLEHRDTRLLGTIPYHPQLGYPRISQIVDQLDGHVLCNAGNLANRVEHTVVAAMRAQDVAPYIRRNTLVVTPGDRMDNILLSLGGGDIPIQGSVSGLVLTGGFDLPGDVVELAESSGVPVILSGKDTYSVASRLRDARFKILPEDSEKVAAAKGLIRDNLDVVDLLDQLSRDS